MGEPAFYFAWVNPSTAFNPLVHNVQDEVITAVHVEQSEGEFASLDITIKNPKIGLLSVGRKVWAWLSWRDADGTLHPLFYGRLVGVPGNILGETVQLQFTARPLDYQASKIALANTLRTVGPLYDPIFLSEDAIDDPDTVLEARPELWSIDRVTHAVTTSNILVGEDGTEEFLATEVPYDSVSINLNQSPLRAATMHATITWDQQDAGQVDLGSRTVQTFTGQSLIGGWPKSGSGAGGGWEVAIGDAKDDLNISNAQNSQYSYSWSNVEQQHSPGDTMSVNNSASEPTKGGITTQLTWTSKSGRGSAEVNETFMTIPKWQVSTSLVVSYVAKRARVEIINFSIETDVQPILTMPEEGDTILINLNSRDIGETGDIGDIKRGTYLTTARGQTSLKYLIAVVRNALLLRSRAVEITFSCRFERAILLTLRKNGLLHDPRLPGGEAVGKVIRYNFSADSDSGVVIGECTIACAVGYGGAIAAVDGDSLYSSDDYDEGDWQEYENEIVLLPASDVGYTTPIISTDDDGMRFPLNYTGAVALDVWHNDDLEEQRQAFALAVPAAAFAADAQPTIPQQQSTGNNVSRFADEAFKGLGTYREIHLRPVTGGPFTSTYYIDTTVLKVPQGIDLESAV
jgi:hypothetical protein